ncbi:MAG TPA: nuclear transport factor 2 family protein [Thermoplasmata archaeon]|nr:nuclear transport factor 2 family protein [Thermoplasmata archaeon]
MSTEGEIRTLEERLRQGDSSPDADTSAIFDELLADDVIFLQPTGFSNAKPAVLNGHRPPKKKTFDKVENSELIIRDFGNAAAVSCRTDYHIGSRRFAFRVARLWIKRAGAWRVAVVMQIEVPEP